MELKFHKWKNKYKSFILKLIGFKTFLGFYKLRTSKSFSVIAGSINFKVLKVQTQTFLNKLQVV